MSALESTTDQFLDLILALHRDRGITTEQAKDHLTAIMGEVDVGRMKEVLAAAELVDVQGP